MSATLHQAGVIAYRVLRDEARVLLITSRDTARWIIPRGNIDVGLTPREAAEKEAYEEAGVRGTVANSGPLGVYTYFKTRAFGDPLAATVEVYLLHVTERSKRWPEKGQRKVAWLSPNEAMRVIQEPGVLPLLQRFLEFQDCPPSESRVSPGMRPNKHAGQSRASVVTSR